MDTEYLPDRKAAVAGRFYPDDEVQLRSDITKYLERSEKLSEFRPVPHEDIAALIVPHAGYIFSGTVAASAFHFLKEMTHKKRIFLIGSSHHSFFNGASVYHSGHYETPLGKVAVDTEVSQELLHHKDMFGFSHEAHLKEHSLEVQLPFLQSILPHTFTIVPLILGSQIAGTSKKLAGVLGNYFGRKENLFIISTDLSHYPSYNDAVKADTQTIETLCTNSPDQFIGYMDSLNKKKVPGLSTGMCGWTSALCLLYMTSGRKGISYHPVLYQNSGDIPIYGDKAQVVGYQSVVVTQARSEDRDDFSLQQEEKKKLLNIARHAILDNLAGKLKRRNTGDTLTAALQEKQGAFVSVYVNGELRGCIGNITSEDPLHTTVRRMAIAAASCDSRFAPIRKNELEKLRIEISVLSPLLAISSPDEIIPEKHGILIKKDSRSGTFLPQVARRTGWDAKQLLAECAERKAGLGRDGWKDAELYTYEALVFSDREI